MRTRRCLVLTMVLGCASHLLVADVMYHVTNLGSLDGYQVNGYGINNLGQVTGSAETATGTHAFLYSNGQMADLGTLPGSQESYGQAINDRGQIAGYDPPNSSGATSFRAFLYSDGKMTNLGTLGGAGASASAINAAGQVVGVSDLPNGGQHAFLWSNGMMKDLGSLGGANSSASGINASGQIAGQLISTTQKGGISAALWSNGVITNLGTLQGYDGSLANAINDKGQITGYAYTNCCGAQAFVYSQGKMTGIGMLPGDNFSDGWAINNHGQIVGYSMSAESGSQKAFLYQNGELSDLNTLVDPALGFQFDFATAINDRGQIVVDGQTSSGDYRSFLLTLVPEPGTLVLLGFTFTGLLGWRANRIYGFQAK